MGRSIEGVVWSRDADVVEVSRGGVEMIDGAVVFFDLPILGWMLVNEVE